jgi:hypothetical protein
VTENLEKGDWCVDFPLRQNSPLCYEVRAIEEHRTGVYVKLRAFHVVSKERFNCSSFVYELALIRKKDGRRVVPPERCG